ncbi:MAG: hypothetical protein JST54_26700 [Deltaproteobacteria bacterium]|nr:hypothetical protein [Deltaproteobacteria bacterium]
MSEPDSPRQGELLEELAQLEAERRARKLGTARMMRVGALVVSASFVFLLRGDIRYWLQPKTPVELGGPLEFNLDREQTERFAKITGVPAQRAANVSHGGRDLRVLGLLGSNVLVVQNREGSAEAPASNAAISVQGRLERDDDANELRNIFQLFEGLGFVSPVDGHFYALYADQLPRQGWTLPLELLGILLFLGVNLRKAHSLTREANEPMSDVSSD